MWILLVLLAHATVVSAQSVVISEVMWAGSDLSTADEWVELAGLGESQTLSGWTLTRLKDGEEERMIQFGEGLRIGLGEFLVVSNYSADQSRLLNEPALSTTAMVLPNTKLLLRLWDSEGRQIDSIDDGVGDPFAGSNTNPKSSMERISLTQSGGLKSNWQTAVTSLGFDSGANLFGTPGSSNGIINNEQNIDSEIQLESFNMLKITELLSDPVGSDTDGEWVEIANIGSGNLNIGGLLLQVGEGGTFVFPEIALGSGEYMAWERLVTGLSLRNAGDIVRLLDGETVIDSSEYPELPEGVSFGRLGESFQSFCIPTRGAPNKVILLDPKIHIQSGETHVVGKVTINLEATVESGSLTSAMCSWDYADGYTSSSCNPPSHTFREIGKYDIHLSLTDYCINTVERQLEVEVLETGVYQEPSYGLEGGRSDCNPSFSTGVFIHDFLPNPEGKDRGGDPTSLSEACEGELCGGGEWIELQNMNSSSANLCGWVLDDIEGGSKVFVLDAYTVQPGAFLKIPITQSKLALNNDGDSVRLFFSRTLMQEITYGEIPEGQTYQENRKSEDSQISPLPWGEGSPEGDPLGGEGVHKGSFTGTIVINEVYPTPLSGAEEWIELFNPSDESLDISGLLLDDLEDGGSKAWTIAETTKIPAHGYIIFRKEETHLALNNDGDELNLINSAGEVLDTVTYPKLKRGLSFSRVGNRWCTTETATPLHKNICQYPLSQRGADRVRGSEESINIDEEKYLYEALNSNSRSNHMINKNIFQNSLSQGERAAPKGTLWVERGWIVPLKTIYKHVLPPTFLLPPEVTSPFLRQVLAMASDQGVLVSGCHGERSRTITCILSLDSARDDTRVESFIVTLSFLSGFLLLFIGRKV